MADEPVIPEILDWDLPEIGSVTACPKCGKGREEYTKAVYHPRVHAGSHCGALVQGRVKTWEDFPEHLCVTCSRCGYGWVEATEDADA